MCVEVLKTRQQNTRSREELRRMGLDFTSSKFVRALRKYGLLRHASVGDRIKSWDVLNTINFIRANVPPGSAVLDIGAYGSEVLPALSRLGYGDLTAVDLNPELSRMPYAPGVARVVCDFMEMPFGPSSFSAVTAISVIEHGFRPEGLLREMSRVLGPGGYFIASVDYWPRKVDTAGVMVYGMDWKVFSEAEVMGFVADAARFGFEPFGAVEPGTLDPEGLERTVSWKGRSYTFLWLVLVKTGGGH